jgi:hypothetical protein
MLNDVLSHDAIGFGDIFDRGFGVRVVEGVRNLAQTVKAGFESLVILPKILRGGHRHRGAPACSSRAQGPQSV